MISEWTKSIKAGLYERTTSPFYGAFIISWAIWNWRIIYLTIFVKAEVIEPINKIEYILSNYFECRYIFWYPLFSTLFLIGIMPLATNGAYWIYLEYEKQRNKWKADAESNRRLTIEQSAQIRNDMLEQETRYEKILESKTTDNNLFKEQVKQLSDEKSRRENNIRILYARYGKNDKYRDVTNIVYRLKTSNMGFDVTNQKMEGDPNDGISKELFIVYEYKNKVNTLLANENDTIEYRTDSIIAVPPTKLVA